MKIYAAAIACAVNTDLKEEWEERQQVKTASGAARAEQAGEIARLQGER